VLSDLTIYLNTNSRYSDLWWMFIGQLKKHWSQHPQIVVACDRSDKLNWLYRVVGPVVEYDLAKKFSSQYLMGLCAVETPYVLPLQEDMLLYADVDEAAITKEIELLRSDGHYKCSRLIDSGRELHYSMQATILNARDLRMLYTNMEASTPWKAEVEVNRLHRWPGFPSCRQRRDDHLPMRGRDHRDSPIFPYIATALTKGVWNSEYRAELEPLHKTYGIDAQQRGWSA